MSSHITTGTTATYAQGSAMLHSSIKSSLSFHHVTQKAQTWCNACIMFRPCITTHAIGSTYTRRSVLEAAAITTIIAYSEITLVEDKGVLYCIQT
eukprot:106-Heterococcus_DN1.PRE.1